MALNTAAAGALEPCEREVPIALPGEVLVRVRACGLCGKDLLLLDGELAPIDVPLVPGHEIVGVVEVVGDGVSRLKVGDRVGVPWLGYACGACDYCTSGRENLCRSARFTGVHVDGGCSDYVVADADYTFALPEGYTDAELAPLLCAGVTGYRAYRMIGRAQRIGLYGDGPAADLIAKIAAHEQREAHLVAPGNAPSARLDAAIVLASDGRLVADALSNLVPGGVVVCAVPVRDIFSIAYSQLADERMIRSVTNITRDDVRELLALASAVPLKTRVQTYALADANRAIGDLRADRVQGAAVLTP